MQSCRIRQLSVVEFCNIAQAGCHFPDWFGSEKSSNWIRYVSCQGPTCLGSEKYQRSKMSWIRNLLYSWHITHYILKYLQTVSRRIICTNADILFEGCIKINLQINQVDKSKNESLFNFYVNIIDKMQMEPIKILFEPPHDKTNKVTCAPSEDSDQSGHPPSLPGHPPSLIRVVDVCSMGS